MSAVRPTACGAGESPGSLWRCRGFLRRQRWGRSEGSSRGAPGAGCTVLALGGWRMLEGPAGKRAVELFPPWGSALAAASAVPVLGLPSATACPLQLPPTLPLCFVAFV